jgi:hypothetical protein
METGYDELRNPNSSSDSKEQTMAFLKPDNGIYNQQNLGIPRIAEHQAIANMVSGNSYIPHANGYSPSQEHLFGWQPRTWTPKDCHLDSWTTMIDDATFS